MDLFVSPPSAAFRIEHYSVTQPAVVAFGEAKFDKYILVSKIAIAMSIDTEWSRRRMAGL